MKPDGFLALFLMVVSFYFKISTDIVLDLQDGDEIIIQNAKLEMVMNKMVLLIDKWSKILHIPVNQLKVINKKAGNDKLFEKLINISEVPFNFEE